ncbi:MAG: hypothetical protein ACLFPQ_06400 [Candidatus Woesearchaeota archaeon]
MKTIKSKKGNFIMENLGKIILILFALTIGIIILSIFGTSLFDKVKAFFRIW